MEHARIWTEIIHNQKNGIATGICSICSANELVIEAAMEKASEAGIPVLIEATANQVNQYGGYTGMTPADFREFVFGIADQIDFPKDRIILGGDHLGPLVWKDEKAAVAMDRSCELIAGYVSAGFTKIHLDTSMRLADDPKDQPLGLPVIAQRAAVLCRSAEDARAERKRSDPGAADLVYIIGSEVPVPGGSQTEEALQITRVQDLDDCITAFRAAFQNNGLEHAWGKVIGVVVQPGVEFGDESIHAYDRESAKELCSALKEYPGLVFEGHSTDYQTAASLREMVEDGIAILKVGPALTFELREALFALHFIERELFRYDADVCQSGFINVLDAAMARKPENWSSHYHGGGSRIRLARKYSLSDRCRYYLTDSEVKRAMELLLRNLEGARIPLTLISQFLPVQYERIRNGLLSSDPRSLIRDRIGNVLEDYYDATGVAEMRRKDRSRIRG